MFSLQVSPMKISSKIFNELDVIELSCSTKNLLHENFQKLAGMTHGLNIVGVDDAKDNILLLGPVVQN